MGRMASAGEQWVAQYVAAWESNDPEQIGALFTDDAVYLTAREAVFVFEGADIDWELDDLVHEPLPQIAQALAQWRELVAGEPRIARPVFVWERGAG